MSNQKPQAGSLGQSFQKEVGIMATLQDQAKRIEAARKAVETRKANQAKIINDKIQDKITLDIPANVTVLQSKGTVPDTWKVVPQWLLCHWSQFPTVNEALQFAQERLIHLDTPTTVHMTKDGSFWFPLTQAVKK
jgi:hypothetical protein